MQDRNAYFKIIDGEDKVSMIYFPPTGSGEPLDIDEITDFLLKAGVAEYDLVKIRDLISSDKEIQGIISMSGCYRFNEKMNIKIASDKMSVYARFYPNSSNGSRMDRNEIISNLNFMKIKFGIKEQVIDNFVKQPEYCKDILIAEGTRPVDGADAFITYNFQTDRSAKPQLNEDGTVDFHHLNNIANVKSGDVLAVLTKEDPGVPGTDVFGVMAMPKKVKKLTLNHGNNLKVSDDGLQLISLVDGSATLEGDKVFVSNNYDVPADVDNSTGDISYNGSITVKGNVRTGFSIEAKGDIEVFGVVEGARIFSEGNIIIHRGIQGMGKSNIVAKGNIISKFIESADVCVDGYIETDTIINSNISARGDIYVRGKNASIIGGNVRSSTIIEAAIIGSPMGTNTSVEVGIDPSLMDKVKKLKDTIANKTAENEKLQQLLTMMRKKKDLGMLEEDKVPMLAQLTKNIILNTSDIKTATAELESTEGLLQENKNAKIRVKKSVYPGTKVTISGDYIYVHDEIIHSEFVKTNGEIKAVVF